MVLGAEQGQSMWCDRGDMSHSGGFCPQHSSRCLPCLGEVPSAVPSLHSGGSYTGLCLPEVCRAWSRSVERQQGCQEPTSLWPSAGFTDTHTSVSSSSEPPSNVCWDRSSMPKARSHSQPATGSPGLRRGPGLVSGGIWRIKKHTDLGSDGVSPQNLDLLSSNPREYAASGDVRMK